MNIVFSSARQWNVGDEFILLGSINLLKKCMDNFNPILYNRHPQLRRDRQFDLIKKIDDFLGKDFIEKFWDNSVKDRLDMDYADLVVFAGSPEWRGRRLKKLYASIEQYNVKTIFLGIGTNGVFEFSLDSFSQNELDVFKKSNLITCRDQDTATSLKELNVHQLPCPALFSSPKEKEVKEVKKIGLIYGTNRAVKNNHVSAHTHDYLVKLYSHILEKYADTYQIEFVAHYIDELSEFKKEFADEKIHYSYDSKDYIDIFNQFDLVIGHRVHGIGMSASLGIPGIFIAHDKRADTVRGFLGTFVDVDTTLESFDTTFAQKVLDINSDSKALVEHKRKYEAIFLDLFKKSGVC